MPSEQVECPRRQGGRLQPFTGEYEGVVGCRLCLKEGIISAYLAGAYRLLVHDLSPIVPDVFCTEELRCQVEGRQSSHKK